MVVKTTEPYDILLRILRVGHQDGVVLSRLSPAQWEQVVLKAAEHRVISLLKQRLSLFQPHQSIPRDIQERLSAATIVFGLRNTKLYRDLETILRRLKDDGVTVIVLKGAHLAELVYENISLRPMDDIDLLVHKNDVARTEASLFHLGYTHPNHTVSTISPHHLPPFIKDGGVPVEVHWTLPPSEPFRIDLDEVWERSCKVIISGMDARTLCSEDLLLHLCLHASVHHRFGIGLRPLCDIAETIRHYQSELDWDTVTKRSKKWRAATAVYLTLFLAEELLGAAVPPRALEGLMPPRFDSRLIEWAKVQIDTRSEQLRDSAAMSPRLAGFWAASFLAKARLLLRMAFPPTDELARIYNLPLRSARIIFYYPVRLKDIISTRGEAAFRLARKDKDALDAARMFNQLIDDPRANRGGE